MLTGFRLEEREDAGGGNGADVRGDLLGGEGVVESGDAILDLSEGSLALLFFGGATIKHFILTMLLGFLIGTYSSLFNAVPLLVVWETGELGRLFKRSTA